MASIQTSSLPDQSLLWRYRENGAYTDCYFTIISGQLSQAQFVEAFYTTRLFKLERMLLSLLLSRPSTDAQAHQLAMGSVDHFAAWDVEARADNQLLLSDFQGRTRSWLMSVVDSSKNSTWLYFGSAVVPVIDKQSGKSKMGFAFGALMGFHRLYSRALLHLAVTRLNSNKF